LVNGRLAHENPTTLAHEANGGCQRVERWTEPPSYRSIKPSSPPRVINQARRIGTDNPHPWLPAQCLHGTRQLVGALGSSVNERDADRRAIEGND
jgi:hypothetical protein